MKSYIALVIALLAVNVYGQQTTLSVSQVQADTQGVPDYCTFVSEQAQAQRDFLRSPHAELGPIQPSTGTPPQMVFGVTESISDLKKASLTMGLAKTSCKLYAATTEAQMHLFYALPGIEKQVLQHRLDLIQSASDQLDSLIASNEKYVDAHNLTKPALYTLQGAKVRLDMSRTETLTGLTTPYVPKLSSAPLRDLVDMKMSAEENFQKANVHLLKQNAWDMKLEGGEHRQIAQVGPGQSPGGLFGTFSLTYNLGSRAANKHLDKSVSAYSAWKTTQFDDVIEQARILKAQIADTITIQQGQLDVLTAHDAQISQNLDSVKDVDSAAAITFKTQLLADRIVLGVDVQDVQFRINSLKKFMQENF